MYCYRETEVKALDCPVRACERRKNPVEGQCSGANLSDIGTSCLDLRKNTLFRACPWL